MSLIAAPGAGAGLTAPPAQDGREMDATLFRVAPKHRLICPMAEEDSFCPCSGQCSDRWGDHALVCACNGDRTVRHNAMRNICYEDARLSGARPERKKAGLPPSRPGDDGLPATTAARRPADIWLPRGVQGDAEALDFACSSGLQAGLVRQVAAEPSEVFARYEGLKRTHSAPQTCVQRSASASRRVC